MARLIAEAYLIFLVSLSLHVSLSLAALFLFLFVVLFLCPRVCDCADPHPKGVVSPVLYGDS